VCKSAAADTRPFPPCSDVTWGAGELVDRYGLISGHRPALLAAVDGRAELSFTKSAPVRLHACLVREGVPDAALEKFVSIGEKDDQVCTTNYLFVTKTEMKPRSELTRDVTDSVCSQPLYQLRLLSLWGR